jgi:hypothetical protein
MEDIKMKREKLNRPDERALVVLDGHSTRLQYKIWKSLSEQNVDAIVLPAHTSNLLQPLDLCVNANFKHLLKDIDKFPSKTEMTSKLVKFVQQICDKIQISLNQEAVRKGFYRAKLLNPENNLENLKDEINTFIKSFPETCPSDLKV